jgi:heat shock protein HslJ
MKKRTITVIFFILAGVFLTEGCINSEIIGEWELVSYGDITNPVPALQDIDTFIRFDVGGEFKGDVGCNSFGGNYHLIGDRIFFDSIYSTEMYCEETWDQEQGVLGLLYKPKLMIMLDNETLTITNGLCVVNLREI